MFSSKTVKLKAEREARRKELEDAEKAVEQALEAERMVAQEELKKAQGARAQTRTRLAQSARQQPSIELPSPKATEPPINWSLEVANPYRDRTQQNGKTNGVSNGSCSRSASSAEIDVEMGGSTSSSNRKNSTVTMWETLNPTNDRRESEAADSHMEIREADKERLNLLSISRETSPVGTVYRLDMIRRTVLPKLLRQPVQWVVISCYVASAVASRLGVRLITNDVSFFANGGSMVTFMIVFYIGYCYNRQQMYFNEAQRIMMSIQNSCAYARIVFQDKDEVHRLWRHLNLLHVAAYTGLAGYYSAENLFNPIVEKYGLFGPPGARQDYERAAFERIDLDADGDRACHICEIWAVLNINRQAKKGAMSPPIHANLNKEVFEIGDALKNIFAASFQVLPFLYTHMVSLSCTVYLCGSAFIRGTAFDEDANVTSGLIIPLIYVILTNITIYGLLVVGDTVIDPFGDDLEDFAVLHFIEHTATASYEAIYCEDDEPPEEYFANWRASTSPSMLALKEKAASGLSTHTPGQAGLVGSVKDVGSLKV